MRHHQQVRDLVHLFLQGLVVCNGKESKSKWTTDSTTERNPQYENIFKLCIRRNPVLFLTHKHNEV